MHRAVAASAAALLLLAALFAGSTPAVATTPSAPETVPALRSWTPGGTGYAFGVGSRVVLDDPDLASTAAGFAHDLGALTGVPVTVAMGDTPRPGDLALRLGAVDGTASAEAYRLDVHSVLTITAPRTTGIGDGTQSVLQLLRQSPTVPGGSATDWPTYQERGFLVDTGRKYFSVSWLRNEIRTMGYLKLNYLHLHLSDVDGFRLASDTHPEIVAAQHYTKQEITDLIAYAARYHVQVIPEIDMPGHMTPILAAHPDLKLVSSNGSVQDALIDLSKPAAYALMHDLITEYLPLFPGPYWHIGGDEYLSDYTPYPQLTTYAKQHYGPDATGKDTYYGYLNWADDVVRAAGKTARMWNDGLKPGGATLTVHPDLVVDHWSQSGTFGFPWQGRAYTGPELVAAGHRVQNDAFTPTYYTTGVQGQLLTEPVETDYDSWDPSIFVDGSKVTDPAVNLGSMLSVWCDDPSPAEDAIAADIHDRLRVQAQQTWGSPKPAPLYPGFQSWISAAGDPPPAS